MSEQDEAELLRDRERLIGRAMEYVDTAKVKGGVDGEFADEVVTSITAVLMANEIREYLEVVSDRLDGNGSVQNADYVRRLAGYARQLEAHELDATDYLIA